MDRDTSNATLIGRADLTDDIARFVVRPDDGPPSFEPGQYLALGLRVGDRIVLRPYSTASRPGDGDTLEFLIRRVPGGTLTPRLWAVPPGGRIRLGRPKGLFTLLADDPRTHLLVATGTGLAPFISMLDRLQARPVVPRAVVVHGVARTTELAYRGHLERLAVDGAPVSYAPTVSRVNDPANAAWQGRTGRAEAILDGVFDDLHLTAGSTVAYLCGNPGMIAAADQVLRRRGLPAESIRTEHYWPLEADASAVAVGHAA